MFATICRPAAITLRRFVLSSSSGNSSRSHWVHPQCIRTLSTTSSSSSSHIQRIGTEDPRMSKIVIHNGIVYMSGLTDTTAPDITGQTQNVLQKVDDLLAQAGITKSNLLTANIWLKDIEADFKDMNTVWCNYVDPNNKPVRATVQSPMARPQILVEIQVTAAAAAAEQSEWEKHHFRQK